MIESASTGASLHPEEEGDDELEAIYKANIMAWMWEYATMIAAKKQQAKWLEEAKEADHTGRKQSLLMNRYVWTL